MDLTEAQVKQLIDEIFGESGIVPLRVEKEEK